MDNSVKNNYSKPLNDTSKNEEVPMQPIPHH